MLTIIAALATNRAIGISGHLIYHISQDLRRFKALTTGHTVIMGRRTFESLPKGALPNRRNIVLTRKSSNEYSGAERFSSLQQALASCSPDEEIFVIGGESVYEEALHIADRLCLTHIKAQPKFADAFFPPFNEDEWQLLSSESHEADENNEFPFVFADYVRIK